MRGRKRTPGICRIDREINRTHGYSVRLKRAGKLYSRFFADTRHGGRQRALADAQRHYRKLLRQHGVMTRQLLAQIPRQKSASGIVGVQKIFLKKRGRQLLYWRATWSPRPNVVRRKWFSPRMYGARRAKALAIKTRNEGVRSMVVGLEPGAGRSGKPKRRRREGPRRPTKSTRMK